MFVFVVCLLFLFPNERKCHLGSMSSLYQMRLLILIVLQLIKDSLLISSSLILPNLFANLPKLWPLPNNNNKIFNLWSDSLSKLLQQENKKKGIVEGGILICEMKSPSAVQRGKFNTSEKLFCNSFFFFSLATRLNLSSVCHWTQNWHLHFTYSIDEGID